MALKIVVAALVGGAVGAAVGFAVQKLYLEKREPEASEDDAEDLAYSYKEAVAKAKAKAEAQREAGVAEEEIDDRVKLVSAPEWDENQRVAYHKIVEENGYTEKHNVWDEASEDPRPPVSQDPESYSAEPVEPWPDEKAGATFRISEDEYQYGSPWHDKFDGGQYFEQDGVLCGWDGLPDPISDEELVGRCAFAVSQGETTVYLRDPDKERDMRIQVIAGKWHDAINGE